MITAVFAGILPVATVPAQAAGWSPPGYVRSFGGRGEAGVYAWGMAYDPLTNQILVGDYWNFYIRRMATDGTSLGQFYQPISSRKGQPESISVDSRPGHGDIYVSEIGVGSNYFAHYSSTGAYIGELNSGARYNAWHTISGRYLYLSDSHYWNNASNPSKVRVYDLDNNFQQVMNFGTWGTTPNTGQMGNIHGIGVDAGGRIYVADGTNRMIHVYTSTGSFLYDFGGPGNGLGQFSGDLRGLAIDQASGAIYVVDANQGQIEKFQMSSNPATTAPTAVAHWGEEGTGPGEMADGGRGITVDGDGNVWVADYGGYRVLKFSPSGAVLGTYPDPAQQPPPAGFSWARDVAVDPQGNVWGADARNNRFQEYGPTGQFLGMWGLRNSGPPYGMDYPRGIGVNPLNGDVWVSDTRDHIIRVYDSHANYIGTAGNGLDSTSTGSFRWPLDVEFTTQGGTQSAWIADYTSSRLKQVDTVPPFTERQSISVTNNGVALDEAAGLLYVLSWSNDDVRVYTVGGTYLTRFGSRGTGTCQFENPWDIDLVNGTLYITDSVRNKVMAFATNGQCLGEWGSKGQGPYQFKDVSGITHDAQGNLYIADANNDRIVEYSFNVPVPTGSDTTAPAVTLTSPSANQVMTPSTVTISGAASDDVGVASVFTSVKDKTTGLWWDANNAIWSTGRVWNYAAVNAPTPTSVTYQSAFIAERYGGSYLTQSKVTDTTGNFTLSKQVSFTVS
jgi:sugar lactone lactonase YvrE